MGEVEVLRKVKCNNSRCIWRGLEGEQLKATNPFDETEVINGCPNCRDIGTIVYACDEAGCWKEATCGTPTQAGYRHTCSEHAPKKNLKGEG